MIGEPKQYRREEQPYVAIRKEATMAEMPEMIPQTIKEVFAWLDQKGIAPAGPPFTRYNVIDEATKLDLEMSVPVAEVVAGDGSVVAGVLPAGQYASLIYTDTENGIPAYYVLRKWATAQGLEWDKWNSERGIAFAGRYECFLTGSAADPDPAMGDTEVAIKLSDNQA